MLLTALFLSLPTPSALPQETENGWRESAVPGHAPLSYRVPESSAAIPATPLPGRQHQVILVLPPGTGRRSDAEKVEELYFSDQGRQGVLPILLALPTGAPEDRRAYWKTSVTAFLGQGFEGSDIHLVGVSNGGMSALALAADLPDRFASVTCLPGRAEKPFTSDELAAIGAVPVTLFVGAEDEAWLQGARELASALRARGAADVQLTVLESQGHVLDRSVSKALRERLAHVEHLLEERREECVLVGDALDVFHYAAATADEDAYFDLFAPGAFFIGTDETERWSLAEFRAFADRYFQRESAWVFTARERNVGLSPDGHTAWFDEKLASKSYGVARGSGALTKVEGSWRITHYVLSFPIPNDIAGDVMERVKEATK